MSFIATNYTIATHTSLFKIHCLYCSTKFVQKKYFVYKQQKNKVNIYN